MFQDHENKVTSCIICHSEFESECKVVTLPCNMLHFFHTDCIESWLLRKPICPMCRGRVCPQGTREAGQIKLVPADKVKYGSDVNSSEGSITSSYGSYGSYDESGSGFTSENSDYNIINPALLV